MGRFAAVLTLAAATFATIAGAGGPISTAAATGSTVTWICNPDMASDPCNHTPLDTTVYGPGGSQTVVNTTVPPASQRPVDCFYLYPSTSETKPWGLAPDDALTLGAINVVAQWQTANFAPTCRIFAPLYRQWSTSSTDMFGWPPDGIDDVINAWNDYLEHDNDGRGVILIGHSQGAILLRQLIVDQIDHNPAERNLLVGAILLGGNVTVAPGQTTGGDFQNVPVCTAKGQFGCVVAYSTFETNPPPWGYSSFGNSATDPLSFLYDTNGAPPLKWGSNYEVACTDPGVLSGLSGPFGVTVPVAPIPAEYTNLAGAERTTLTPPGAWGPITLPSPNTTWMTDFQFTGSCQSVNNANAFIYNPLPGSPEFGQPYSIGTHELDFQLGVNRLVKIATLQAQGWLAAHP